MSWLESDDYFVSPSLKIFKYDLSSLSSGPVEMVPAETNVTYGGPEGEDFKSFLRYNNFAVNRQGRAIVRVAQSNARIAAGGGGYNIFLLEKVVPLDKYRFTNVATPMQRTLEAIRDSTKKVFVDVDLKPPAANGDPNSVLIFLRELRDVLDGHKKSPVCKPEDVKFPRPRCLKLMPEYGDRNLVEFFRRMNRTYVNEAGVYINFDFTEASSGTRSYGDNGIRFYAKERCAYFPFKMVQCDLSDPPKGVTNRRVSLAGPLTHTGYGYPAILLDRSPEQDAQNCAFVFNDIHFIGKIRRVQDTFRDNALVTVFFEQFPDAKSCYVDARASTFFVYKSDAMLFDNDLNVAPELL